MPTITLHLPDGMTIPDGYEPVADLRDCHDNLGVLNADGRSSFTVIYDVGKKYIVLRPKWQPPERLKGSGLWLAQDGDRDGYWLLCTQEPEWCTDLCGFNCHGRDWSADTDAFAMLGLTTFPDLSHLPPEQRKVQL